MPKLKHVTAEAVVERWLNSLPDTPEDCDLDLELADFNINPHDDVLTRDVSLTRAQITRVERRKMNNHAHSKIHHVTVSNQSDRQLKSHGDVALLHLDGTSCSLVDSNLKDVNVKLNTAPPTDKPKRVTFKQAGDTSSYEDLFQKTANRLATADSMAVFDLDTIQYVKHDPRRTRRLAVKRASAYIVTSDGQTDSKDTGGESIHQANEPMTAKQATSIDYGNARVKPEQKTSTCETQSCKPTASSTRRNRKSSETSGRESLYSGSTMRSSTGKSKTSDDVEFHLSTVAIGRRKNSKPIIKGLVVDSASYQQPSIVRASKNANIREEFALKQRVDGYRSACSDNINRINIAQRRMNSHLVNLKNKMASVSGSRAPADDMSIKLFLHNKGYLPKTLEQQASTYCFPPLMYPKRRLLTVN